jgi:glycosyltransferase involved in cell wall biosynthesis
MLFDVGDVDAMGAAALELLRDEDRMATMREAARAGAIERFSEEAIVERYREIYELALRA